MERFSKYTFAAWPDESLNAAIQTLDHWIHIVGIVQNFRDTPSLVVELSDRYYKSSEVTDNGNGVFTSHPKVHRKALRLTWETGIFALECFDEFYSAPYGENYIWKPDASQRSLHEIISEPDAWIQEIVEDNPHTGVFPPYGPPALVHAETWAQNPSWPEPTGRFYPANQPIQENSDFIYSSIEPLSEQQIAEAQAEIKRLRAQREAEIRSKPRYRHLFIASDSHMLEILCEDLPRWEWIESP